VEPVLEPTVEPEPLVEPTVEPEPLVESVLEPTVEPEPVVEPEPLVESVLEPTVEPEPVVESVLEPTVEPEPVVEPVVEQELEPTLEQVVKQEPDNKKTSNIEVFKDYFTDYVSFFNTEKKTSNRFSGFAFYNNITKFRESMKMKMI